MVELTVVRFFHLGRDQARRLEQHIAQADVICWENVGADWKQTNQIEEHLNQGRRLAPVRRGPHMNQDLLDICDFQDELESIRAEHRKPVVFLERPKAARIQQWKTLRDQLDERSIRAHTLFTRGDYDASYEARKAALYCEAESAGMRDDWMLEYAPHAVKRVEQLRGPSATYLILLGVAHNIASRLSDHLSTPVLDIYLPHTPYSHLDLQLPHWQHLRNGTTPPDVLACEHFAYHLAGDLLATLPDDPFHLAELGRRVYGDDARPVASFLNYHIINPLSLAFAQAIPVDRRKGAVDSLRTSRGSTPAQRVKNLVALALEIAPDAITDSLLFDYFPRNEARPVAPLLTQYPLSS